MRTHSSPTKVSSQNIQLDLPSELNEFMTLYTSHIHRTICFLSLALGIIAAIYIIPFSDRQSASYKASLHIQAGSVRVLQSTTDIEIKLAAGDTVLVEVGDQISIETGEAILTHFDGKSERLLPDTHFTITTSNVNQKQFSIQKLFEQAVKVLRYSPTSTSTVASTLG